MKICSSAHPSQNGSFFLSLLVILSSKNRHQQNGIQFTRWQNHHVLFNPHILPRRACSFGLKNNSRLPRRIGEVGSDIAMRSASRFISRGNGIAGQRRTRTRPKNYQRAFHLYFFRQIQSSSLVEVVRVTHSRHNVQVVAIAQGPHQCAVCAARTQSGAEQHSPSVRVHRKRSSTKEHWHKTVACHFCKFNSS